jgi:TonB family protein
MIGTAQYLILANICLAVLLGFYIIFLKKETFFQLNRAFLLFAILLSFILPVLHMGWAEHLGVAREIKYSIVAEPITIFANKSASHTHFTIAEVISWSYLTGIAVLAVLLIIRLMAVKRIILNAESTLSYSFFRKVYLGNNATNQLICEHENIHAAQWHSADILLIEVVVIFNWFNPLVYLFRRELKNVHEFIADEGALKLAGNKKAYATLLLSQTFETPINNLVNTFFNKKLLKQRIMMIQKNKSQRKSLLKYLLSAPVIVLMLILSSATTDRNSDKAPSKALTGNMLQATQGPTNKVFTVVEHPPTYPGGLDKLYKFLGANIHYPAAMREKKVEGKVLISFIVGEDGSLSNIKILREPGYGSGEETVRVMKLSPKWIPGVQNGKKVRVQYTLPVTFTLKA